jgi:hypothetical protein
MYVDVSSVQQNGQTYTRYLLRESYRQGRQVKHRTIATPSQGSPKEIEAIRLALHPKEDLTALGSLPHSLEVRQGPSVGAVWVV